MAEPSGVPAASSQETCSSSQDVVSLRMSRVQTRQLTACYNALLLRQKAAFSSFVKNCCLNVVFMPFQVQHLIIKLLLVLVGRQADFSHFVMFCAL